MHQWCGPQKTIENLINSIKKLFIGETRIAQMEDRN